VAGVVAVVIVLGLGSAVSSMFSGKPEVRLKPIAERMAAGPKSPEDAHLMRVQLDSAVTSYLEQHGQLSSADLLTKLQSEVPSTAFEVLVFDLPNKMKLVEMTCVLQPSDYLVVPTPSGKPKVSRISGLSVFDDSRLIAASPEPVLILLGHTTGDKPKQPQVNAVAVLPTGEIADRSDKLVPPLKGSGGAAFVGPGSNDIKVERTIVQSAKDQQLFDASVNFRDEPFVTTLTWKNNRYDPSVSLGGSEVGALYAVANALVDPAEADTYRQQLSAQVRDNIKAMESKPVVAPGNFKIGKVAKEAPRRRSRRGSSDATATYVLTSGKRAFEIALVKSGRWSATGLKETSASEAVATEPIAPEPTPVAATPEPAPEPKVVVQEPEKPKAPVKVAVVPEPKKPEPKPEPKPEKTRTERPREEKKSEPKKSTGGRVAEIARRVTMRTGPARQNEQIMDLGKGEQVRIIGERSSWYKVSVNGKEGWIYNSYVKKGSFDRSDVPSVAAKSEPPAPKREKKERKEKPPVASTPKPSTTASKPPAKPKKTQISTSKQHHVDRVDHSSEPDFVP